jgi:hypothetical protein
MQSIKALTRLIKETAESHKQVNTVVTGEQFEREEHQLYPLIHIVPGSWTIRSGKVAQKFLIITLDLGSEDTTNREENLSDTQLVFVDIFSTLIKSSQDLDPLLEWEMNGDSTKVVDGEGDCASGWVCEVIAYQQYQRDVCDLPMD